MCVLKVSILLIAFAVFLHCSCQEYDFAAEMTRQCLVPDPVGLLDCVEKKVTLPYLTSWVDCTNSLGQNVKTSTDIINYRCRSVWEGKGLIPEVFYIKDCVIEKTGLPAKNVSAEVLGAYRECENTPNSQSQQIQQTPLSQDRIKTAPIQQQQINTPFQQQVNTPIQQQQSNTPIQQQQVNTPIQQQQAYTPIQQQRINTPIQQQQMDKPIQQQISAAGYGQTVQPMNSAQMPAQRRPFSQQYFVIYPRAPLPVQHQFSAAPVAITQQQLPISAYQPPSQQISQQQLSTIPFGIQQQLPVTNYLPQAQITSPGIKTAQQPVKTSYASPTQQASPLQPQSAFSSVPYYYGFEIQHPQRSF